MDQEEEIDKEEQKEELNKEECKKEQPASSKRKAEWFEIDDDHNTYVYVQGLPKSITEDDFIDLMKRYGIIAKKPLPGQPFNVKLYKDENGLFKGDALCCYVKVESVHLALEYLDEYRYDDKHILHCERGKFKMKGAYDPSKKPKLLDKKTKLKQKKNVEKILSWADRPSSGATQKKVILKNMFDPEDFIKDAEELLNLKEDVESKCTDILKCEPRRVDVYDKNPEGVVAVTFSEPEQANIIVQALDNQCYAGRYIKAELWDGKTKYKIKENDEDQNPEPSIPLET